MAGIRSFLTIGMMLSISAFGVTAYAKSKRPVRFNPDPSSVFAADIAFSRLSVEKGVWTAFRETMADDALLLMPDTQEVIVARGWLKGRANPDVTISWKSDAAFVSCDGRSAATSGQWKRGDGAKGDFITIWQRNRRGEWNWTLDHFWDVSSSSQAAPAGDAQDDLTILRGTVAKCKSREPGQKPGSGAFVAQRPAPDTEQGGKNPETIPPDDSLIWTYQPDGKDGWNVSVSIWNGNAYETVIGTEARAH